MHSSFVLLARRRKIRVLLSWCVGKGKTLSAIMLLVLLSPTIPFNLKITPCSLTRGKCSYVSSKRRTRGESSLPCDYSVLLSTTTPVVPEQKLVVHGFQDYRLHRKNILEHWSSTTSNIKF